MSLVLDNVSKVVGPEVHVRDVTLTLAPSEPGLAERSPAEDSTAEPALTAFRSRPTTR
jgi:hypothetical protein